MKRIPVNKYSHIIAINMQNVDTAKYFRASYFISHKSLLFFSQHTFWE